MSHRGRMREHGWSSEHAFVHVSVRLLPSLGMALIDATRNYLAGNTGAVEKHLLEAAAQPTKRRGRPAVWIPSRQALLRDEYVAVDFETANRISGASACQVAMVKVAGGEVVEEFCTYLRPPEEYIVFEFSHIHGIDRGDVEGAPSWFEIADDVVDFISGVPVYAHNATFDASVWRGLDRYYCTGTYPEEFYCTCRMARRVYPELPNHTLPTVTEYCAPGFKLNHHRADSDALACAHIVAQVQRSRSLHESLPA